MPKLTKEEIIAEFHKYKPKRKVSKGDIENVRKHGLGIVKATFGKPGGGEGTTGQQAQKPGTTDKQQSVLDQMKETMSERQQLTKHKSTFLDLMEKGLEAKQKQAAPFLKKRKKEKQKLLDLNVKGLEKLRPGDQINAVANKISRHRNEIQYIDQQKADAEARIEDAIEQMRLTLEDQIAAHGLELEDLGLQYKAEQDLISLAFSPDILASGVMPDGVPEGYVKAWEAASNRIKAEMAAAMAASRGGGGGYGGGSKKSAASGDAYSWAELIMNEAAVITNVPSSIRSDVASLLAQSGYMGPMEYYPTFPQWTEANWEDVWKQQMEEKQQSIDPSMLNQYDLYSGYQEEMQNLKDQYSSGYNQWMSAPSPNQGGNQYDAGDVDYFNE